MYEYYKVDGSVSELTETEATKKMYEISPQWEDENTKFGKLFMGVYDWAFTDKPFQLLIPNLRTGGSIQKNEVAIKKFGFDIFGDCFLKIK
jgi:hypothetical protein